MLLLLIRLVGLLRLVGLVNGGRREQLLGAGASARLVVVGLCIERHVETLFGVRRFPLADRHLLPACPKTYRMDCCRV